MAQLTTMMFVMAVTELAKAITIDMAPNAVDDDFEGCSDKMSHLVETKYLDTEKNGDFKVAWDKTEKDISTIQLGQGLQKKHLIAMSLYTQSSPHFYKFLNDAVMNGKDDYKNGNFAYYSFYFLLVDAIKHININNVCMTTYRGLAEAIKLEVGSVIRFGRFASSTRDPDVAVIFANEETCYEIETCHGAEISKYSKIKDEEEILIPPYEKFKVVEATNIHQSLKKCKATYKLKSDRTQSNVRCAVAV